MDAVWVAANLKFPRNFGANQCIGFYDETGKPVAGFVFHNWQPEQGIIEMSAYAESPRWATRRNLRALFAYPFGQCGCQMVMAYSAADNVEAARMWRLCGASEWHIPRLMGRETDGIAFTLTDDAWYNSKVNANVQTRRPEAA